MRWQKGRRSQNVEDRRGRHIGKKAGIGGGLIIAAIMAFFLKDSSVFFTALQQQETQGSDYTQTLPSQAQNKSNDEVADFVSVILADLEDTWAKIFNDANMAYQQPKLVLYSGNIQSACGYNTAKSGPFYCPGDAKIYLDLSFLGELKRMGASGDFAFAYVIAHEVGHHISNLIGTLPKVHQAKKQMTKQAGNQLSILLELQADCFAGIWAYHANKDRRLLEPGDVKEGLQAAASVGDDALIGNRPDLFTHGTSQQRMQWLSQGLQSGDVSHCDTFKYAGINL